MPRRFVIAPLPAAHIDQAFPVVQHLRPAFTPAQWRALAAPFAEGGATHGIIGCRMGTGHIRGLFCYALDDAGAFRVGPFAVAGLFDAAATADGLIEAAGQLAQSLGAGCVAVERGQLAVTTVQHCDLPELFARRGYRVDGDLLVREGAETVAALATA